MPDMTVNNYSKLPLYFSTLLFEKCSNMIQTGKNIYLGIFGNILLYTVIDQNPDSTEAVSVPHGCHLGAKWVLHQCRHSAVRILIYDPKKQQIEENTKFNIYPTLQH